MKKFGKVLFIALALAFVASTTSCDLINGWINDLLGKKTITVSIDPDYLAEIDTLIVKVMDGADVTEYPITVIAASVTVEHDGDWTLVTVEGYDDYGSLVFTGRIEPGADKSVTIVLQYVGGGNASHIILVQDGYPWDNTSFVDLLGTEGFTEGLGVDKYEIITSAAFTTKALNSAKDLVVIVNDQDQNFYDTMADNNAKLLTFISNGGTVLWEACDNGWAYGSIATAGLSLPGDPTLHAQYEYYNDIVATAHPLFEGLTGPLYNNYASHEWFTNLPTGTNILMRGTDSTGATLITYPYGSGLVFVTGQPLEFAYTNHPEGLGAIVPNFVRFVLGTL